MISSSGAPDWAIELVLAACADAGVVPPRQLRWRRRRGDHSTGVTRHDDGTIAVRAGAIATDQRLTLLHELAHWLARPAPRARRRRAVHHGRAFYRTAFWLYERNGIPAPAALEGEAARYPSSLRHAAALGVSGARAALDVHRTALRARPRAAWRVLVPEHAVRLKRDGRWTVCAVCRQKVVGIQLTRMRRRRGSVRHVLLTRG